eukprot:g3710.t1
MVACCHLLIKHSESRNPISRRTGESTANVAKSAAHQELSTILAKLRNVEPNLLANTFQTVAQQRSDCGSFRNGGDLGDFSRGQMQKPFEDASFALKVGEMSDIVDSDSGLHIIYRYG